MDIRANRLVVWPALAGLALLASSCGASSSASPPTTKPRTTPSTAVADGTAAGGAPAGKVFFKDDFPDSTDKAWGLEGGMGRSNADEHVSIVSVPSPALSLTRITTGGFSISPTISRFENDITSYSVTAILKAGGMIPGQNMPGPNDLYGISCHVVKASQYDFLIKSSADGSPSGWIIVKEGAGGHATPLAHGDLPAASGPLPVTGVCGGTADSAKLSFMVNGKTVGQVTDADHPLTGGNGGVTIYSDKGNTSFEVMNFAMATV